MNLTEISFEKKIYLFEIDDVLIPRQDYLLQVYYLFSNFYDFTEGTSISQEMVQFMKKIYLYHGAEQVFKSTQEVFGVGDEYAENLERLQANAQLPLKLHFFEETENLLIKLIEEKKSLAILTKGNPVEQLNKLKHLDWGKLDSFKNTFKVYFLDELEFQKINPLDFIASEYAIEKSEILYIDKLN